MIGIISVDKVEAGMVLAEKVLTPKRMMLLPAGVTLTPAHLITFQTWGVTDVNIEGEGGGHENGEMTAEEQDALKAELAVIFKHNDLSQPLASKLFELAIMYPREKS